MLLRSLGRELIASIDRITLPLMERDRLIYAATDSITYWKTRNSNRFRATSTPKPRAAL